MPFVDNIKFKEILGAARGGNEKAKMIMQAMMKGNGQEDVDRLVNDYYNVGEPEPIQPQETPTWISRRTETQPIENQPIETPQLEQGQIDNVDSSLTPEIIGDELVQGQVIDLTDTLDTETEGLFDEADYEDLSFGDFIKNKKADANKIRKNGDYFKAFDMDGRQKYIEDKENAYKSKFDTNLKDIERNYNDIDKALNGYLQGANDQLDDEFEFDQDKVSGAYNDFTGNDVVMHSFGRFWDNDDNNLVIDALRELMAQYGKANVIAALNILKSDNGGHRDYLVNSIDQNIGKYSKSIEKLLK